jgi:hypothetical protein
VKVKLCVPFVQPALPLLLIAPPLGARVEPLAVVLKAMLPAVVFVRVTVLLLTVEVALPFAPETTHTLLLPQVLLIAALRWEAFVELLPLRTMQGAVLQLLFHV